MAVARAALGSGLRSISRVALGTWRLADAGLAGDSVRGLVEHALEHGITTVDLADVYGGYGVEALVGEAVPPSLRDRLELVSKCGIRLVHPARPAHRLKSYDASGAHIVASVERSLADLRTDRLDLLLLHRPDPLMDAEEVASTFARLLAQGKVRAFGVSNHAPSQVELLAAALEQRGIALAANQVEASPLALAPFLDGTFDQCQQRRMLPMAWSPLGGGRLFDEGDERAARVRTALHEVGQAHGGAAVDQVALAWLLRHPARIVPVLGTTRPERLAAAAAAGELVLEREEWFAIWSASTGVDVP